jgi:MFS family permease
LKLPAALAPLESQVFRGLWFAWLAANMTMWMNDVAAAWLMTMLTPSPTMVALVQTASTLPVFLLGLPSGALADIVDRRLYFAGTQLWVSLVALLIAALALAGMLTPSLLLLLTFLNGIGLAMRWPVFSAIVPEVVGRDHLPAAMALNGISMNMSRVIGPVVAGALLASAGTAAVFVLNALLAGVAFVLILRWRAQARTSVLPGERFVGAMRVGLQHVRQSPRMRAVVVRVFLFFLQSSALLALLPLVAKGLQGGGAGTFTLLMASLGAGAITAALLFPRWRRRFDRDDFTTYGTAVQAAAAAVAALVPEVWMAVPAVFISGMAWISTANTLSVSAQLALPNWVRARGMAIYQMALMAGTAFGAMLFGKLAGLVGVPEAIVTASVLGAALLPLARRWSVEGADVDFSPAVPRAAAEPAIEIGPDEGPVMVTVEYLIDDADVPEFTALMQLTRAARLRQGALSWALFRDTALPGRWVEHFVDENWIEHQRRLERFTAEDAGLRARRTALHRSEEPPLLRRFVADRAAPPHRA